MHNIESLCSNPESICSNPGLLSCLETPSLEPDEGLLAHLENCTACQQRLEDLAVGTMNRDELAGALQAEVEDDRGSLDLVQHAVGIFGSRKGGAWNEERAAQWLEAPVHPEILGRLGRYQIERMVGHGAMGIVFKAYDTELNRTVAIKMLSPYLANSPSARQRFARESRAAAGVVDDHVVPIYNVDSTHNPPYLVMQYVAGGSLQEKLDRDGFLEVEEVLRIGLQTARGLAAAHKQGLIHRDVKPSNVLLDEGVERALLTDFGLARVDDDPCLTKTGFQPGTPDYMSPEQVQGQPLDARSDLFGLGCLMYALAVGHSPFHADTSYAAYQRIVNENPQPVRELNSQVPGWLDRILLRLLSQAPVDRYESAEAVADLLESCLAHWQQPHSVPLPVELNEGDRAEKLVGISIPWSRAKGVLAILFAGIALFAVSQLKLNSPIETPDEDPIVRRDQEPGFETKGGSGTEQETASTSGSKQERNGKETKQQADGNPVVMPLMGSRPAQVGGFPAGEMTEEAKEFGALLQEHQRLSNIYSQGLEDAKSDDEVLRVYRELDPRETMPEKYLAFEAKYRGAPEALQALTRVAQMASSVGDPQSKCAVGRIVAFDRLKEHYAKRAGLEDVISSLQGGPQVPKAEEFLESLVKNSPYSSIRAHALLTQIESSRMMLDTKAELGFPWFRAKHEAVWKQATKSVRDEYMSLIENIDAMDVTKSKRELANRLLQLGQYADVQIPVYGTASNAALRISNSLNVIAGETAPELLTTDLEGRPFKLSAQRGKIVVLLFTCCYSNMDYREMYGPFRKLVAKYKSAPVRFVAVMATSDPADLKKAVASKDITWTVIPQKVNGPIQLDWGITGFHFAYPIDAKGTLQPKQHLPYFGDGGYDTTDLDIQIQRMMRDSANRDSKQD